MINHAWFGLSVDSFIGLILKGWVMLGRKWSSGQTLLPAEAQGLGVSVNTAIRGHGHPQGEDQWLWGHL